MNASNVRNRVLAKAAERANEELHQAAATPLPDGLTPHRRRHTFASLLVALGTDPGQSWTSWGTPTQHSRSASTGTACDETRVQRRSFAPS
jgi:integrase